MAVTNNFIMACLVLQFAAVIWVTPVSTSRGTDGEDFHVFERMMLRRSACGTYKGLETKLLVCKREVEDNFTGERIPPLVISHVCASMPSIFRCAANILSNCNQDVRSLITEHLEANNDSLCSPEGWVHRYVFPTFVNPMNIDCARAVNASHCFDLFHEIQFVHNSSTVAEGLAINLGNVDVFFRCMLRILPRQVSNMSTCNLTWKQMFYALLYNVVSPQNMVRRLSPDRIAQLGQLDTYAQTTSDGQMDTLGMFHILNQ